MQIPHLSVRGETVAEAVQAQLRDLLIRGELRPGTTYTIRGLARSLGTSSMPIRSALHALVAEGALEVLPNRSLRVPLISSTRYQELSEIRAALEGLAAEWAARQAPRSLVAELRPIDDRYLRALRRADRQEIFDANRKFHFALYAHCRAPALLRLIDSIWLLTGPYVNVTYRDEPASKSAGRNHRKILVALSRRDPAACRRAVENDIRTACRFTLKALRQLHSTGRTDR